MAIVACIAAAVIGFMCGKKIARALFDTIFNH